MTTDDGKDRFDSGGEIKDRLSTSRLAENVKLYYELSGISFIFFNIVNTGNLEEVPLPAISNLSAALNWQPF